MMKRFIKNNQGVAAIEASILLLVFILMLFAIIELGRAFWSQATLNYAVEEAARFGIVSDPATVTDNQILGVAQTKSSSLSPAPTFVFLTPRTAKDVNIKGTYTFEFILIPYANITLTAISRYQL